MPTSTAVDLFLKARIARGLAPQTIRWYRGILFLFARKFPMLPEDPTAIDFFLSSCKSGDERRHGYYRAIRCLYRFLKKRYGTPDPTEFVDPPRIRKKQPIYLTPEEIHKLLNYPHPPKIKTALLFLLDSGCRLGELHSLDIGCLKDTPWGFVARINGKAGTRDVPISYETYHALMVNLPFTYKTHRLGELISKAFHNAEVKGSAHILRHSFATLWQGDELVLQRILGHAHLSTTRLYRHMRLQVLAEQHRQYSPLKMVLSSSRSML